MRWFDLIGLQRHIKVLGIFARLFYRDGKSQYLKDLPRVLAIRARRGGRSTRRPRPFAEFIASAHRCRNFQAAQQRARVSSEFT